MLVIRYGLVIQRDSNDDTRGRVPAPRDGFADALQEAAEIAEASLDERYALFEAACALVFEMLVNHPNREEILSQRDPLLPDHAERFERARTARPSSD